MRVCVLLHASPACTGAKLVSDPVLLRGHLVLRRLFLLPRSARRVHRHHHQRAGRHPLHRHLFHRILYHGPHYWKHPLRQSDHLRRRLEPSLSVHRDPGVPPAQQHDAALLGGAHRGAPHHPHLVLRGPEEAKAVATVWCAVLFDQDRLPHGAHLQSRRHVQVCVCGRPRAAAVARGRLSDLGSRVPDAQPRAAAAVLPQQTQHHARHAPHSDRRPRLHDVRGHLRSRGQDRRTRHRPPRLRLLVLPVPLRGGSARRLYPELHHDFHRPQEDHLQHFLGGPRG
mmetsp:Transcript_21193/g.34242  ORF Transcript_21193/g.34242 Transcript_21193/m.34242 type:complete len:283 (+) Transcript_21193:216-1064(+)